MRAKLIDGNTANAYIFAGRLFYCQTRQEIGGLGIMTVTSMARCLVESGKNQDIAFVWCKWFQSKRQAIIFAGLVGKPRFLPHTVGEVNAGHADGRLNLGAQCSRRRRGWRGSRKNLAHRFEQRQSKHDAGSAQKSAPGD